MNMFFRILYLTNNLISFTYRNSIQIIIMLSATRALCNIKYKKCIKTALKRPPPSSPVPFKDLTKSALLSYLAYYDEKELKKIGHYMNDPKHEIKLEFPLQWLNFLEDLEWSNEYPRYYDGNQLQSEPQDSQAYCWLSKETKSVYVSFRGTSSFEDAKSDLNVRHTTIVLKEEHGGDVTQVLKVHSGFYDQAAVIIPAIIKDLTQIADDFDNIILTGHSLGSALSTITTVFLYYKFPKKNIINHTFGSPRVGDHNFAKWYSMHIPDNWRVYNEQDPVACIPISHRFCHVKNGLCINDNNELFEAKEDDNIFIRFIRLWTSVDATNIVGDHDNVLYIKRLIKCI